MNDIPTTIYHVWTEGDVEGRTKKTLGYCIGNKYDVQAYFLDKKYYGIYLEEVDLLHISRQDVEKKEAMNKRKTELELELESIKKAIQ